MLDRIIPLKRIMRNPWEMLYIGVIYSSIAILFTSFIFSNEPILSQYLGILLPLFTLICCMPYMYQIIIQEEGKDIEISPKGRLVREHTKAIRALMWLFVGLVIGFSFWYLFLPVVGVNPANSFDAQIKTFCVINHQNQGAYDSCLNDAGLITGKVTGVGYFLEILSNNIAVLAATLLFSLLLGAGAIFILIWNATVIATAIGMFAQSMSRFHLGLLRYLVHGLPEISAYFIAALAGGIVSVALIRRDLKGERLWMALQDAIILTVVAVIILFVSAFLEVYITPAFFY